MSDKPESHEGEAEAVAPAPPAQVEAPLVPMRAMRVISVGADTVSAPYSPGPDSVELGEGVAVPTSAPLPLPPGVQAVATLDGGRALELPEAGPTPDEQA
ncbi:MAG TPA: hypothetical protein VLC09_17170, partial [Polyangiaceae bacterium]|nr:hypothetical protein [Polyangiaceae bacterium]